MNLITALQDWYQSHCNGHWEHGYGVRIQTLDNPGWSLDVHLQGTNLVNKPFTPITTDRTENDWVRCFIRDGVFMARGGPSNLTEMLETFLEFSK